MNKNAFISSMGKVTKRYVTWSYICFTRGMGQESDLSVEVFGLVDGILTKHFRQKLYHYQVKTNEILRYSGYNPGENR